MKTLITLLLLTCSGCVFFDDNTDKALDWINEHPKPIYVTLKNQNGITSGYRYTFIDSQNKVAYFEEVHAVLPDTIKILKN